MIELIYNIPKAYKNSFNSVYSGVHWTVRKKHADYYHLLVRNDVLKLIKTYTIDYQVDLYFRFTWKKYPLDSSNCSYMGKCLEDWLTDTKDRKTWIVIKWLLRDDSPKYVRRFICESLQDKSITNDIVEIIITKVDKR